jgi:hypothetical protein
MDKGRGARPEDNAGKLELALARLALTDPEKRKAAVEMLRLCGTIPSRDVLRSAR